MKSFDYSSAGAYFITICTQDRKHLLSEIENITVNSSVGEGLAPPGKAHNSLVKLKPCGCVVEEQLLLLEERYPSVTITDYVIMPDHIHAIVVLTKVAGGASPSPTISDVVCAFKSLTSRNCKQKYGVERMFQRSFAEHIIRDKEDFETRRKYIYENPTRWYYQNSSK